MDDRDNIELIKEKIDIVSFIGKYVKLKQAGKNFVGLCPFHEEKTPSFSVNSDLGIFKCFGCGKGGDIFTFIQEIERIEFPDALEKLAKEAGVEIIKKDRNLSNPLEEINELAKRYFQHELTSDEGKIPLKYLHDRGFDDETISIWGIGYATGNGKMYKAFKQNKKYTDKQLIDSGLYIYKDKTIKEKFKKRIMFPIFNNSNKVIAFTGRILPKNDFGPKYLNSPETNIYQKRNHLYGLNFSKSNIRREDLCIILEGQTDVIASFQAGFPFAVAPLGTGLTSQQLSLISNYTKNILFLFDSDLAGQKALERAFILASQLNLSSFAANTGVYKDIDEMLRKNPKEIPELIKNRTDCFSYLVATKMANFDSSSLKSFTELKNYIFFLLSEVKDISLRNFYIERATSLTGIIFEEVQSNHKQISANRNLNQHLSLEDMYIHAILNSSPIIIPTTHNIIIFKQEQTKKLLDYIVKNSPKTAKDLLKLLCNHKELYSYTENILMKDYDEISINEIYGRLEKAFLETKLRVLRTQVAVFEEKRDTIGVDKTVKEISEISNKLKKYK